MRDTNTNSKKLYHVKHTEIVSIIQRESRATIFQDDDVRKQINGAIPNDIVEMESIIELKLKLLSSESSIEKVLNLTVPCTSKKDSSLSLHAHAEDESSLALKMFC